MNQKEAWILCLMVSGAIASTGYCPAAAPAPTDKASSEVSNSVVKVFATVLRPDPARPWTKQAPAEVTGSGAIIEGERIHPADGTVARINGKTVRSLKHLVGLLRETKDEFITIEFDQPDREALVFARKELVAATERILTNNGVRAQGSPAMIEVWQGR